MRTWMTLVGLSILLACSGVVPAPSGGHTDVPTVAAGGSPDPSASDEPADTDEPTCPDGVVVAASWPGEWPTPVPDVTKRVKVPARSHPCGTPDTACEIEPGVYHPWAKATASTTTFVHVRPLQSYRASRDLTLGEVEVSKGTVFTVERYLGEGFCEGRIGDGSSQTFSCPGEPNGAFVELPATAYKQRTLFQPACGAWVDAEALLTLDSVGSGDMPEYGLAVPAKR